MGHRQLEVIMDFEFRFNKINNLPHKEPICRIELNGHTAFTGKVKEQIKLSAEAKDRNVLRIFFENKSGKDTVVNKQNEIVQDLTFELEKVIINGLDLKHLIWQSRYVAGDNIIDSCLFFGPKGHWELEFDSPVLKWILRTNHNINNNDPGWEADYNYYEEACQKLEKIR
tara:strand:- start:20 stop:529 length:510 start_codon:yes stop_codon:yes gene_type:complete